VRKQDLRGCLYSSHRTEHERACPTHRSLTSPHAAQSTSELGPTHPPSQPPALDAGLDELLGAEALREAGGGLRAELEEGGAALRRRALRVVERCLLAH
jgi:hypothetical protein